MKNPTAVAALDLIRNFDGGPVCYDHFAFRTFGVSPLAFRYFMRRFASAILCLGAFFLFSLQGHYVGNVEFNGNVFIRTVLHASPLIALRCGSIEFRVGLLLCVSRLMDVGLMPCHKYSLTSATKSVMNCDFRLRSCVRSGFHHLIICWTWKEVRLMVLFLGSSSQKLS